MTNVFTCLMKKKFGNGNGSGMDRDFIGNGSARSRKLFALLLCLLFVGVGQMWGATTTTYTFSSAKWAASPSNWTSVTDGSGIENTGSARGVANNNVNGAATSPSSFSGVTSISVVASANKGDGSIKISIGSTEIATKTVAHSNNETYTFNSSDYATIASLSGNVKIEVTAPSSSKTLWVKSVAITYVTEKFTVTYNAGSGTCATSSVTQTSIGQTLTLPSASPNSNCAEDGWVFAGWATASCTETITKPTLYAASSSYIPLSTHTLYAVYRIGDIYSINFENSSTSAYTDWTFTNLTTYKNTIAAHSGSYYGNTNGKASGNIATANKIASPKMLSCYISKESDNVTSSTWYVEVSSNGSDWGDPINSKSATGMGAGVWQEFAVDLSDYSNVFARIRYDGSTATRAIDDLELSCATYNSNPDCVYDYFIDIMHDNETIEKQGSYDMPDAPSDATPGSTYCDEKHYHFLGWVEDEDIDEDGSLKSGYTLYPAGDDNSGSHYTANNKTFYAVWAKEE